LTGDDLSSLRWKAEAEIHKIGSSQLPLLLPMIWVQAVSIPTGPFSPVMQAISLGCAHEMGSSP